MYHFFAFMARMKYIKRWGLMRNTETENIKEHSFDAAVIAHALAVIRNTYFDGAIDPNRVLSAALYHEAGEVITGDLPTPVKYFNEDIRAAYKNIERIAADRLLIYLPPELRPVYQPLLFPKDAAVCRLVKAADKLCAYIKCVQELHMGNREFEKAMAKIKADLENTDLPEVQYFLTHMLPSYTLTLDELNR